MIKEDHNFNVDAIISFILIKKIITPIIKTNAYKMGLVDSSGNVIKEPETIEERNALTLLDRIVFKLKKLLGGKIVNLNNFLFTSTINSDFYKNLIVRGSIKQRAEIVRIINDIKIVKEKYNINNNDLIYSLLKEELEENF